jgi:PAS domain-containing protein
VTEAFLGFLSLVGPLAIGDLAGFLLPPSEDERPNFTLLRNGKAIAPQDLPLRRAAQGENVAEDEIDVRFPDGDTITILVRAATLRGPGGDIRGAVAAAMDITERRRAEERHKLLVNELNVADG